MNQDVQWLYNNIQQVENRLHTDLNVQILSNFESPIDAADVIWLPHFKEEIFKKELFQTLTHKRIIVVSNRIKDLLIENGCRSSNITVCSFWGPNIPDYDVSPAPFSASYKEFEKDQPFLVVINKLHRNGGIGVIKKFDNPFEIDYAFFGYVLAGIPIVAPEFSIMGSLVKQYQLGMTYTKKEDFDYEKVTADQYNRWARNSSEIGKMILNNDFVKEALVKQSIQLKLNTTMVNEKPKYGITVMDSLSTLDYIAQHHCSVTRLGDGEISLLLGANQVFQETDPKLQKRLDEIVKTPSNNKLLVCLSDTFHDLERYVPFAQKWWQGHLKTFQDYYAQLGELHNIYGNTMVTRPYMDLQNRNDTGEIFRRIKLWWEGRDILIVEGKYTRSGVGNDLYDNARSVQRIICPSKNAWSKYDEIIKAIKQYGSGKLVLVMLGMTATVIAADLSNWGQVIDSGHLDPEYEWYRMGATTRIAIKGKHTAEMNYDEGVPQHIDNPKYLSEIITDLS